MSDRFAATFARLHADGACGLFPYFTAGFPDLATSAALLDAALDGGADGFEIGVPFSDPLADGATLQRANTRALAAGATLDTALDLARLVRRRSPETPVVLMTYYNPVLRRGEEAFAEALAAAGGDGVIVPDLPVEEADSLATALGQHGLALLPMVAPTSPDDRVRRIARLARGFIYCVALVGVTGARTDVSDVLASLLARLRGVTTVPLVAGFGISRPEHVRRVAGLGADGAIVGSALVDLVERSADPVAAVRDYVAELKVSAFNPRPSAR